MMIVAIDDEKLALEALVEAIKEAQPEADTYMFQNSKELLEFVKERACDVAFMDIEMRGMNGLELARRLKQYCPFVNIIFVTGYSHYSLDAYSLRVSGYLMKPVSIEDIIEELKHLRNPLQEEIKIKNTLRVQTFGNFEVFYGDQQLHFTRSKAKELFAYLIDRKGASCSMAEIAAVLWEDQTYSDSQLKQIHTCISEMKRMFAEIEIPNVLVKKRNSIAVNVNVIECDYYKFIQGDLQAINAFTGEYMANYSWAEFTISYLLRHSEKYK